MSNRHGHWWRLEVGFDMHNVKAIFFEAIFRDSLVVTLKYSNRFCYYWIGAHVFPNTCFVFSKYIWNWTTGWYILSRLYQFKHLLFVTHFVLFSCCINICISHSKLSKYLSLFHCYFIVITSLRHWNIGIPKMCHQHNYMAAGFRRCPQFIPTCYNVL